MNKKRLKPSLSTAIFLLRTAYGTAYGTVLMRSAVLLRFLARLLTRFQKKVFVHDIKHRFYAVLTHSATTKAKAEAGKGRVPRLERRELSVV